MTYKEYVLHQLREMRRELTTAVEGVAEADLLGFEPCDHWPIAWIAEHCTQVADIFLVAPRTGSSLLTYEDHVGNWPNRAPTPDDPYPTGEQIISRWEEVCDHAIGFVEGSTDDDLQKEFGREPFVQSILRVVNHTNSHLRSLWCILGERRVDQKWAEQQNFLA